MLNSEVHRSFIKPVQSHTLGRVDGQARQGYEELPKSNPSAAICPGSITWSDPQRLSVHLSWNNWATSRKVAVTFYVITWWESPLLTHWHVRFVEWVFLLDSLAQACAVHSFYIMPMAESPWALHSVHKMESKTVYILQMISIRKQVHNGKCSTELAVDYPVSVHGRRWMGMEQAAAKCSSLLVQFHLTSLKSHNCWSCSLRSGWENCVSEVLHCLGWW